MTEPGSDGPCVAVADFQVVLSLSLSSSLVAAVKLVPAEEEVVREYTDVVLSLSKNSEDSIFGLSS